MRRYPDIHPDAFTHPADQRALDALKKVPGFDLFLKKLYGSQIERKMFISRRKNAIKIGENQYRSLYRMVAETCEVLGIEEVPEVYLERGGLNAWAFGFTRHTITLYSGLVEQLPEPELRAVIGHELGHIACEHMLYKSLADVLSQFTAAALNRTLGGVADLFTLPLELALAHWNRAAELSCDRAAHLVVENVETVASMLTRLAGGVSRYQDEMNLTAILEQFDEAHDETTELERVFEQLNTNATHPLPIVRVHELLRWSGSMEHRRILRGDYVTRSRPTQGRRSIPGVPQCGRCLHILHGASACPSCGLRADPVYHVLCKHNHLGDVRWKFCKTCAAPSASARAVVQDVDPDGWDPTSQIPRLHRFLSESFSTREFHSFLRNNDYNTIIQSIPDVVVAPASYFDRAVFAVRSQGLGDQRFFERLRLARPNRPDLPSVARLWGIHLSNT